MQEVLESELKDLLGYWDRMRGNKRMPARSDIDPLNIPRLLPHLALIETAESLGDFRYRLYGTEVCQGFGNDRTGVRLDELKEDVDNYDEVYAGYWRVYADKVPDYFYGRIVSLAKGYKRYCASSCHYLQMMSMWMSFFAVSFSLRMNWTEASGDPPIFSHDRAFKNGAWPGPSVMKRISDSGH